MMLPRNFETNRANGPIVIHGSNLRSRKTYRQPKFSQTRANGAQTRLPPRRRRALRASLPRDPRSPRPRRRHRRGPRPRYRRRPLAPDPRSSDGKCSVRKIRTRFRRARSRHRQRRSLNRRLQRTAAYRWLREKPSARRRKEQCSPSKPCKPNVKRPTNRPGRKPSCSPNWPNPKAKPTTLRPISHSTGSAGEFVYSAPEIARLINRAIRLDEGKRVPRRRRKQNLSFSVCRLGVILRARFPLVQAATDP